MAFYGAGTALINCINYVNGFSTCHFTIKITLRTRDDPHTFISVDMRKPDKISTVSDESFHGFSHTLKGSLLIV